MNDNSNIAARGAVEDPFADPNAVENPFAVPPSPQAAPAAASPIENPFEDPNAVEDPFADPNAPSSPAVSTATPAVPNPTPNAPGDDGADYSDLAAGIPLGIAKGVFAASDFFRTGMGLWGGTPAEKDRSALRQWVDSASAERSAETPGYRLSEGLAQGAVGLLGAGKLEGAGVAARTAAGVIGSVAVFEPHAQNLANMAQKLPVIGPTLQQYLGSDENDSTFKGYLKNALTSLGFEGAVVGLFTGTAAVLKAAARGDKEALATAQGELAGAMEEHQAAATVAEAPAPTASPARQPEAQPAPAAQAWAPASPPTLEDRIRSATFEAGGGQWNQRVPLREIRNRLPDVPRDQLDDALRRMHVQDNFMLSGEDNPASLRRPGGAEKQAAGLTYKGEPMLYAWQTRAPKAAQETEASLAQGGEPSSPATPPASTSSEPSPSSPPPQPSAVPGEPPATAPTPTTGASPAPSPQGYAPRFTIDDRTISALVDASAKDQAALLKYGSWDAALANGHTFGSEEKVPWQLIGGQPNSPNAETGLDAFTARVKDAYQEQHDAMKGGAVQSDAENAATVNKLGTLWGADPTQLLGMLSAAGDRAGDLRATMEASYSVAQRALQDAYTLSARINAGEFGQYGTKETAMVALKQQVQVGAQAFGSANSILANSARTLRGARSEFRLDPMMIRNLASTDGDQLVQLLNSTKGDPQALAKATSPGIIQRLVDGLQFYMVNNLVSSPLTHAVIAASNTWQALGRPAMRMAGAKMLGTYDAVGREAQATYGYMASAIPDAFSSAVQAFKAGDSIIAPHDAAALSDAGSGGSMAISGLGQQIAQ